MRLPGVPNLEDTSGKRRSARWSVDGIVAFALCHEPGTPAAETATRWVNLIDLSPTGVSILSKTQLAPGDCFVLALPTLGDEHLPVACAVQYSRVKIDGSFRVGAQFCDPATAGAHKVEAAMRSLEALGVLLTDPARPESDGDAAQARKAKRRAVRRLAEGRAVIHAYDEFGEPGPVEEVPALDFSETGVCIFRREPMQVGDLFMARVPLLESPPIISLCRVANVTRCDGENRYRIGAKFISTPGILRRLASRVVRMFVRAA